MNGPRKGSRKVENQATSIRKMREQFGLHDTPIGQEESGRLRALTIPPRQAPKTSGLLTIDRDSLKPNPISSFPKGRPIVIDSRPSRRPAVGSDGRRLHSRRECGETQCDRDHGVAVPAGVQSTVEASRWVGSGHGGPFLHASAKTKSGEVVKQVIQLWGRS